MMSNGLNGEDVPTAPDPSPQGLNNSGSRDGGGPFSGLKWNWTRAAEVAGVLGLLLAVVVAFYQFAYSSGAESGKVRALEDRIAVLEKEQHDLRIRFDALNCDVRGKTYDAGSLSCTDVGSGKKPLSLRP